MVPFPLNPLLAIKAPRACPGGRSGLSPSDSSSSQVWVEGSENLTAAKPESRVGRVEMWEGSEARGETLGEKGQPQKDSGQLFERALEEGWQGAFDLISDSAREPFRTSFKKG